MVTDRQTLQDGASDVPAVREKLRRSGYTLTSQRRAVLEALSRAKGHPSAEDVYLIVKRENPRVALGTVYHALSVLEEVGVIGSKHWSESPTRYDLNVDPHLDIRCTSCGEVSESPASISTAWKRASTRTPLTGLPTRRWSWRAFAPTARATSQHLGISGSCI
jgi:Fe2+ or Zn2+ uptake regulation protein